MNVYLAVDVDHLEDAQVDCDGVLLVVPNEGDWIVGAGGSDLNFLPDRLNFITTGDLVDLCKQLRSSVRGSLFVLNGDIEKCFHCQVRSRLGQA